MRESTEDIARLQELLDTSFAASGSHLRSAFQQDKRLSAADLAARLGDILEIHFAVIGGTGAPLVAPLDALFLRGRLWVGIAPAAVRTSLVRRDPRVSASFNSPAVSFIVHGTAVEPGPSDARLEEFRDTADDLYVRRYGPGWLDWAASRRAESPGGDFVGFIEPRVMFATGG